MSLINDALRRAKEAQQQNPPPAPNLQFRPAEATPKKTALPAILAVVALLAVAGVAVFQGWRHLSQRGPTPHVATVADASSESQPVVTPPRPAVVASVPAPTPAAQSTAHDTAQANVASTANPPAPLPPASVQPTRPANNAAAASEPVPAKPPLPKLQGILYLPDRPAAVVDGKTLFVGDRLGEARVTAISRESVTVADGSQTNTLTLKQ